ncbi:hypothetical protein KEH59_08315 [Burkholderia contaminans]|uniref:hypothetical protein n=1 Tax=Burkholderia contaminans TaxID=488447 RepID=UPI001BA8D4B2|nr:hypothetical protein [Burkholderia contaminans]QUN46459.1 hypothetical protein KEH59_08315 [Burkholderia contaminans]
MRKSQAFVIPLIAASSLLMEQIDATVISTAIPKISATLGVSALDLKMAISVLPDWRRCIDSGVGVDRWPVRHKNHFSLGNGHLRR